MGLWQRAFWPGAALCVGPPGVSARAQRTFVGGCAGSLGCTPAGPDCLRRRSHGEEGPVRASLFRMPAMLERPAAGARPARGLDSLLAGAPLGRVRRLFLALALVACLPALAVAAGMPDH